MCILLLGERGCTCIRILFTTDRRVSLSDRLSTGSRPRTGLRKNGGKMGCIVGEIHEKSSVIRRVGSVSPKAVRCSRIEGWLDSGAKAWKTGRREEGRRKKGTERRGREIEWRRVRRWKRVLVISRFRTLPRTK